MEVEALWFWSLLTFTGNIFSLLIILELRVSDPAGIPQLEYWSNGIMDSWIGMAMIEVGGASAYGGLEAEGQKYRALGLRFFVGGEVGV